MAHINPRVQGVCIIGSGAAGLITAHTLIQDGFSDVQIITRDRTPGGVWSEERVYPGLTLNNVHGEFKFSSMPMPAPSSKNGSQLGGEDMRQYMQKFRDEFLEGKIKYETNVLNIERTKEPDPVWNVTVSNVRGGDREILTFSRIVLCTGGCSTPKTPPYLSQEAANKAGFQGLVVHSIDFGARLDEILAAAPPGGTGASVVVVGGGKSAQDISAHLANEGRYRYVTAVFETADAFLGTVKPLPDFVRKSRLLAILSPHIELRTRLERFLHRTWIGSKIVHAIWNFLQQDSYTAFDVPANSPLRRAHSPFWSVRLNDEGVKRDDSFFSLVNRRKISLVAPAQVTGYDLDGRSLTLSNGTSIRADVVILATGYKSSWENIFDDRTQVELGIQRHAPDQHVEDEWDYASLANSPSAHPENEQWASSIYRGIVPAKNVLRRDFAINGASFTTNNGYSFEVMSHWISSYFLNDAMRLPSSPEEALKHADRNAKWMRKRYPDQLLWLNESYSSHVCFLAWPQYIDELLEDMGLRSMRSGGNWLTWAFKVIDVQEIATLKEERDAQRNKLKG
ncbi:FAD/NAD(P)-binding domain-containing protein [Armillaria gallica]|uniref:FAD/NAD(P)-binding domain-containing protein n=1 Tax=Armillaria gallica TaxID=47427 RepID=A0A2H3DH70_ARMGA|nr:FAD/NAD(P)-binding domain-containing protein [Armillaria gallica]